MADCWAESMADSKADRTVVCWVDHWAAQLVDWKDDLWAESRVACSAEKSVPLWAAMMAVHWAERRAACSVVRMVAP